MGFIQPCFIRKNSKELRDLLSGLGYYEINVSEKDDVYKNLRTGTDTMGRICRYMQWYSQESNSCIDCGTNEELFLAIAALRDDDCYMQYYWYKDKLYKCIGCGSTIKMNGDYSIKLKNEFGHFDIMNTNVKKATVAELIEHFK